MYVKGSLECAVVITTMSVHNQLVSSFQKHNFLAGREHTGTLAIVQNLTGNALTPIHKG